MLLMSKQKKENIQFLDKHLSYFYTFPAVFISLILSTLVEYLICVCVRGVGWGCIEYHFPSSISLFSSWLLILVSCFSTD